MDRFRFTEGSSGAIEFDILDHEDVPVEDTALTDATLTLYDLECFDASGSPVKGIINGRSAQDVLDDNNVTIDASGHVIWSVQPEDNAPPDDEESAAKVARRQLWRHRAKFHFVWASGSFNYECELEVLNLRSVL